MVAICEGRVHLVHRHRVHARHLVLLLPLHPPVLEPDLDLALGQTERVGDLDPGVLGHQPPVLWRVLGARDYLRRRVR